MMLTVTPPLIDDVILIKSNLHVKETVSFKLTSRSQLKQKFTACKYFITRIPDCQQFIYHRTGKWLSEPLRQRRHQFFVGFYGKGLWKSLREHPGDSDRGYVLVLRSKRLGSGDRRLQGLLEHRQQNQQSDSEQTGPPV